ncbi:MAG: hypothetical protein MK212_20295, partial [Saprospiraceae bacterium]|nr:hypothetical protein [Saprospiraceae bacterium]
MKLINLNNTAYFTIYLIFIFTPIRVVSQTQLDSNLSKKIVQLAEESKEESFDLIINELHHDTPLSKLSLEQLKDWEKAIEFIPSEKEYFELKHLLWAYFSSLRAERFSEVWIDLAHSYYYSSAYAFKMGNYIVANQFIDKCIELYEENKKEKPDKIYAESILFKASIVDYLQLYGYSFKLYEKAALAFQEVEDYDPMFLASLYMNLGVNYIRYGFYEKAKNKLDQAKKIFIDHPENVKRSENKKTKYARWLDLYTIYSRLFYEMEDENQLLSNEQDAQEYIRGKSLSSFAEHYYAQLNNYIGFYYLRSAKDFKSALSYFKKAYNISTQSLSPRNPDFYKLN